METPQSGARAAPHEDNAEHAAALTLTQQEYEVTRALRYAVSRSAGFAAIALWCPWVVDAAPNLVACTNGKTIRFGPRFFEYAPLEQAAILVHEVLHVALRHIPRLKRGRYDPLLWNICTDAVINEAIRKLPPLRLPADSVRLDKLLTREELERTPPHKWTSESLYAYLLNDKGRLIGLLQEFVGDLILVESDSGIFVAGDPLSGKNGNSPGNDLPIQENQNSRPGDDSPLEEQIWKERLLRAQAGDAPGGLLREVSHDFPTDVVRWERILRRLMTLPLMPRTQTNWNRSSRRTLALESDFWEPGIRPRDGLNLAGVVVDTSGSIDDKLLTRFAAEIQAIQQRTGCAIYLISADAAVQTEQMIRNDGKSFKAKVTAGKIAFKGGGGTDFYPALQRMKEQKVRVCVYLTDLMGSFGNETAYPFPIIWASVTPDLQAPFGKTVPIRE